MTLKCTYCGTEFKEAETDGEKGCPQCGRQLVPDTRVNPIIQMEDQGRLEQL